MNNTLNKFREEMEKRGLLRRITAASNLIPPPTTIEPEALLALQKSLAKNAVIRYAQIHDDFCELMADAATDHLFDTILTDDLFRPAEGFVPTDEERAKAEKVTQAAKAVIDLRNMLEHI